MVWYGGIGQDRTGQDQNRPDTEQSGMASILLAVFPRWKTSPGVIATADTAFFLASTEVLPDFLVTQA